MMTRAFLVLFFCVAFAASYMPSHAQNVPVPIPGAAPMPNAADTAMPALPADDENEPITEPPVSNNLSTQWQGSLLFNPPTIEKLRKALQFYRPDANKGGENTDFLSEIANVPTAETIVVSAPYFYLGSIIYSNTGEWFIWLNGKKIAASRPLQDPRLTITSLSTNAVSFKWKPATVADIQANWSRRQQINDYNRVLSPNVNFNRDTGEIDFTLRPNQTFFSATMQVVEGRVIPNERLPKGLTITPPIDSAAAAATNFPADAIMPTPQPTPPSPVPNTVNGLDPLPGVPANSVVVAPSQAPGLSSTPTLPIGQAPVPVPMNPPVQPNPQPVPANPAL